jgi:hypothetical protein
VQQKQGRVKPTLQAKGAAINDDPGLESEADRIGGALERARAPEPVAAPRAGARNGAPAAPPVQRKMRVIEPAQQYTTVAAAKADAKAAVSASESHDWDQLTAAITAPALYTVKLLADLITLADGKVAEVLRPNRHVIGENHKQSRFDTIKGEWPGVPAVEEGLHSVIETGLNLAKDKNPKAPSPATSNFANAMQSKTSNALPLENYHAASLARLMIYLAMWNRYQIDPTEQDLEQTLLDRTEDVIKIYDVYASVSASVFTAGMDASWLGFSPRFAGKIEEAYGQMFAVLTHANAKASKPCLDRIASSRAPPKPSKAEVIALRAWLGDMIGSVGDILKVSAAARPDAAKVGKRTDDTKDYVKKNPNMTSLKDTFALVNPNREQLMAEHIAAAPKPSLIKVGREHLPGLDTHRIADAVLHGDAKDFDGALSRKASDL